MTKEAINHKSNKAWMHSFSRRIFGVQAIIAIVLIVSLGVMMPGRVLAQTFNDVPRSNFAFDFIESLAASGITAGCGGGDYCPEDPVTRAQMAVFLERGINGSGFVPPAATGNEFGDVGASDFAAAFIEQLFLDGITSGCGGNNYCPNDQVTRAQMAVFLLRAKHGAGFIPPPATGIFADAPLGSFAVDWIEQLAAEGITAGCGGGNYCPNDAVTRAQMAVFLVRAFSIPIILPPPTTGPVASVAVTPAVTTLVSLGDTLQLTATASDANGNAISGKTFAWSSSDESIATVTDSGLVTALANGPELTITAATDGVEGTAAIEVGARPPVLAFHAMAYDAESDRVILFAAYTGVDFRDTWAYDFDTNSWTNMNPATSPDSRVGHAMAYDAQSDRVILFGGAFQETQFGNLGDTWAYDFNSNAWTDMSATPSPTARLGHQMVYDARSDRIILFGGQTGPPANPFYYDETWAYDFDTNAWRQLSPSTKPSERVCFAFAYDAESGRVILFGEIRAGGLFSDTWAYDFNSNAWTDMNPAPRPSIQNYPAMAYDAGSDRVILFGGSGGDETWAYDFNTNAWTNMNSVTHPSQRWAHAMAYDEGSDRVVLFGGETNVGGIDPVTGFPTAFSNETWAYDFNSNTWTHMH